MSRQKLVSDAPERVPVGARVDRSTRPLLRRHVSGRSVERTRRERQRRIVEALLDAEVGDFGDLATTARQLDKNVSGFQITMDDSPLVSVLERVGDLAKNRQRTVQF